MRIDWPIDGLDHLARIDGGINMIGLKSVLLAASALAALAPSVVSAQTQTDANADAKAAGATPGGDQVAPIIVTARKRAENALNVPISITAFTGQDLADRDIQSLANLAAFTPSLTDQVASTGGARADRSAQVFIIRGMTDTTLLNPTTSVFLNGVPLGAGDFLHDFDDVDHVEVLKGPQSAYFGRQTFAGAINAVAKPAGNSLAADGSFEVGTRNTYRLSTSATVPIINDVLSVRVGGLFDTHHGSYRNASDPSQTLGDQQTTMGHVAITFKPLAGLTIKAFGMIFEDKDGPAATGVLLANGPAAFNQSNCKPNGVSFICGTLPGLTSASPAFASAPFPAALGAFLTNPGGIIKASQVVRGFGLKRLGSHGDVSADYVIPNTGLTLSYLGGFDHDNYSTITDLANLDTAPGGQYPGYAGLAFFDPGSQGFPFLVEDRNYDFSHEVRLASDPTRRFHLMIGGSYLKVYHEAINTFVSPARAVGAPSVSETKGAFFSAGFDILPNLNLTAEGRYIADTEISENTAHAVLAKGTSHNFAPRVSLQYKPIPDMMVYATYSKGVNPGVFNTQFNTLPAVTQAELRADGGAGQLFVKPETLDNYEVGVKGRFWNGRMTLSGDIYYDRWNNQILQSATILAPTDPANPYNVVGSSFYNPANTSTYTYQSTGNNASSTLKGIEGEATIIPVRHFTLNLAGAINDSKYRHYFCLVAECPEYPVGFQAAGKRLPFAPEFNAAVGGMYQHPMTMFGATEFFARVDYLYHSGIFTDASNLAKTQTSSTVNLRAGFTFSNATIEGYVNNVFNNRAYTTAFDDVNFAGGFAPAVYVGLPDLITGGVRVRMHF